MLDMIDHFVGIEHAVNQLQNIDQTPDRGCLHDVKRDSSMIN